MTIWESLEFLLLQDAIGSGREWLPPPVPSERQWSPLFRRRNRMLIRSGMLGGKAGFLLESLVLAPYKR